MEKTFKDLERIIIMREWATPISTMSNEQKGILLQTIFDFADCKEIDIEDPMVKLVWGMIEPNIDRINRNYLKRVNNGKKGGAPVGNTNNQSQPKVNQRQPRVNHSQLEVNRKLTDRDRDRDKEEIKKKKYNTIHSTKAIKEGKIEFSDTFNDILKTL